MKDYEIATRFHEAKSAQDRVELLEEVETYNNSEAIAYLYNLWGQKGYDEDVKLYKYKNHKVVALAAENVMGHLKEQGQILDIAAGTGLLGIELKKLGFKQLDALDGSAGMLEVAKNHGVYGKLYEEIVQPGSKIKSFATGHFLVISGSIQDDKTTKMLPAIAELVREGLIEVVKEAHIKNWWAEQDGIVWTFKRLK